MNHKELLRHFKHDRLDESLVRQREGGIIGESHITIPASPANKPRADGNGLAVFRDAIEVASANLMAMESLFLPTAWTTSSVAPGDGSCDKILMLLDLFFNRHLNSSSETQSFPKTKTGTEERVAMITKHFPSAEKAGRGLGFKLRRQGEERGRGGVARGHEI